MCITVEWARQYQLVQDQDHKPREAAVTRTTELDRAYRGEEVLDIPEYPVDLDHAMVERIYRDHDEVQQHNHDVSWRTDITRQILAHKGAQGKIGTTYTAYIVPY